MATTKKVVLMSVCCALAINVGWSSNWRNIDPSDVSNDGFRALDDVLIILNRIDSGVDSLLPETSTPPPFYDVSNDGHASPLDALIILNEGGLEEGAPAGTQFTPSDVNVRFEVVDALGDPIDTVSVGNTFTLNAWIDDATASPFAGFVDITYPAELTSTAGPVVLAQELGGSTGVSSPGMIANVGSSLSLLSVPDDNLLFRVPFIAESAGVAMFAGQNGEALARGTDAWLSANVVGTQLQIVPEPHAAWLACGMLILLTRRKVRIR